MLFFLGVLLFCIGLAYGLFVWIGSNLTATGIPSPVPWEGWLPFWFLISFGIVFLIAAHFWGGKPLVL